MGRLSFTAWEPTFIRRRPSRKAWWGLHKRPLRADTKPSVAALYARYPPVLAVRPTVGIRPLQPLARQSRSIDPFAGADYLGEVGKGPRDRIR